MRTTILLVDEHLLLREALKTLIQKTPGFKVVAHGADPQDAAQAVVDLRPHVLLTGLSGRPLIRLMRLLQELTLAGDKVRTIVLTATSVPAHTVRALQLGAFAVLSKASPPDRLVASLRAVRAGQTWVGHEPAVGLDDTPARTRSVADAPDAGTLFGLTRREQEIVAAVGRGESNKTMARRFSIAEDTVKHHMTRVFNKTGVFTRLELAVFAINHGLVPDRPAQ